MLYSVKSNCDSFDVTSLFQIKFSGKSKKLSFLFRAVGWFEGFQNIRLTWWLHAQILETMESVESFKSWIKFIAKVIFVLTNVVKDLNIRTRQIVCEFRIFGGKSRTFLCWRKRFFFAGFDGTFSCQQESKAFENFKI